MQRGNGQVIAKRVIIGTDDMRSISPFLRLSEDWFAAPGGFETHPHRGMQTVTFVLEGALHHKDHTGADGVLHAGDVQWMTAGRGALHSEMPHEDELAHTLQLWLNLPSRLKMIPARYVDQRADTVAVRRADGAELRIYAGISGDVAQPHGSDWPVMLIEIKLAAGASIAQAVPASWRGFVYVLHGSASLGTTLQSVEGADIAWFEPSTADDAVAQLQFQAKDDFRALLVAGPPIDEDVVAYGPFVMTTTDEIRQAILDYQTGRLTG